MPWFSILDTRVPEVQLSLMDEIVFRAIGFIRTPFRDIEDMPIQPSGARGVRGRVEVERAYAPGLRDLDGFSHVVLLYHLHRSRGFALEVTPFMDEVPRGVFATRAPRRPNALGMSVVKLVGVEEAVVEVEGVDILDGTPLLDIKPHVPAFDCPGGNRTGWLEENAARARHLRSDDRFG